jgi:hypothetical protein
VAREANSRVHRRALCRERFTEFARRNRAIESLSLRAIVQTVFRGAATSLLDWPTSRPRQNLAGQSASIHYTGRVGCGFQHNERIWRHIPSGRPNTNRLSPRARVTRRHRAATRVTLLAHVETDVVPPLLTKYEVTETPVSAPCIPTDSTCRTRRYVLTCVSNVCSRRNCRRDVLGLSLTGLDPKLPSCS